MRVSRVLRPFDQMDAKNISRTNSPIRMMPMGAPSGLFLPRVGGLALGWIRLCFFFVPLHPFLQYCLVRKVRISCQIPLLRAA